MAKALLVGADVAMMTSAVLRHGPEHVRTVEEQLVAWMRDHEYDSVSQLRGSVSYATSDDPAAFERTNYVRMLHSWSSSTCVTGRQQRSGRYDGWRPGSPRRHARFRRPRRAAKHSDMLIAADHGDGRRGLGPGRPTANPPS